MSVPTVLRIESGLAIDGRAVDADDERECRASCPCAQRLPVRCAACDRVCVVSRRYFGWCFRTYVGKYCKVRWRRKASGLR